MGEGKSEAKKKMVRREKLANRKNVFRSRMKLLGNFFGNIFFFLASVFYSFFFVGREGMDDSKEKNCVRVSAWLGCKKFEVGCNSRNGE